MTFYTVNVIESVGAYEVMNKDKHFSDNTCNEIFDYVKILHNIFIAV